MATPPAREGRGGGRGNSQPPARDSAEAPKGGGLFATGPPPSPFSAVPQSSSSQSAFGASLTPSRFQFFGQLSQSTPTTGSLFGKPSASTTPQSRTPWSNATTAWPAQSPKLAVADKPEPPVKRQRINITQTIVVCVGEEAKDITVVQSIAARSSKVLQAAVNRDWEANEEKRIVLPGIEPEVFEGYLQWLYTGDLTFVADTPEADVEQVKSYLLGVTLKDERFRNAAVESIIATHKAGLKPGSHAVELAWTQTAPDSLLRTLILKLYSTHRLDGTLEILGSTSRFSKDFVLDFVKHLHGTNRLLTFTPTISMAKFYEQLAEEFKVTAPEGKKEGSE